MCGRYASYRKAQELAEAWHVDRVTEAAAALPPSYNVAPTQPVRVVLEREATEDAGPAHREMHAARWGLVPAWASDLRIGNRMINARLESLEKRPAYRASLERRRCIVAADGYYEWQRRDEGGKVPHYIHGDRAGPIALAGLYAFWRDPERADDDPDRWVLSTTIVTGQASGDLARLHDRVPVVLDGATIDRWLDPATRTGEAVDVLTTAAPRLRFHPVSNRVNRTTVDEPELIEPVTAP